MKNPSFLFAFVCAASVVGTQAEIVVNVTQGEEADLAATYDTADLIQGLIPLVLPGDTGWHSVNTDPLDQLPAFTDGEGIRFTGLTGLLNDFPGVGQPAKLIQYAFPVPSDLHEIRVFTGNEGRDGRVFHTYTVRFSTDWANTFSEPIYVQSHPSGSLNNLQNNYWRAALSQLTNTAGLLASEVTHLEFNFYSVDNTGGQMRDPFDGLNPFTQLDDGLTAAFVSPLVWEIDVIGSDSLPRIQAHREGAGVHLTWLSRAGSFIVQAATELSPTNWADLNPQPAVQTEGVTNSTVVPLTNDPHFYRLRLTP